MPIRDVSAKIGTHELPVGFNRPEVSSSISPKIKTLHPIDTDPVHQVLSPGELSYTLHGDCFTRTANYIDSLRKNQNINIRTRRTGTIDCIVKNASATSTNVLYDTSHGKDYKHKYDITVAVTGVVVPPPGAGNQRQSQSPGNSSDGISNPADKAQRIKEQAQIDNPADRAQQKKKSIAWNYLQEAT